MSIHYRDIRNFLSKLTARPLINALQVLISSYLTRLLGGPIQWGLPMTVSIELTTACNLRCPECPGGLRAFIRVAGNLKTDSTYSRYLPKRWHLGHQKRIGQSLHKDLAG